MQKLRVLCDKHKGFLIYGVICIFILIVDIAVSFLFELVTDKLIANAVGMLSGFLTQYFLASKSVFNSRNKRTFIIFFVTFLIGLVFAELIVLFSRDVLFGGSSSTRAFMISKGLSILFPFFLTYGMRKKWIRESDEADAKGFLKGMNSRGKSFFERYMWLLIPAGLTALLCFAASAMNGVFPFGSRVSFYWDGHDQMLPYLQAFRQAILSGKDIGYSMQSLMGMDNVGLFAYYLSSPLNLLVLLFPSRFITDAFTTLVLFKMALAAGAFAYFAHYHLKLSRRAASMFALAYALMSWAVSYSFFFMWLDGYIWLPIVCAAINRLLKGKSVIPLISAYFFLFLSNYYTGFMVAVFSLVYFAVRAFYEEDRPDARFILKKGAALIASGTLAFGMVAVMIFPAAIQLASEMDKVGNALPAMDYMFNLHSITGIFPSMLAGGSVHVSSDGSIKLYQSVLAVILLIGFFVNKNFSARKKMAVGGGLLFLFLTMQNNWSYLYLWNLGNDPNTMSFRCSFVLSFAILCAACLMFRDVETSLPDMPEYSDKRRANALKALKTACIISVVGLLAYNGTGFSANGSSAITIDIFTVNLILMLLWALVLIRYIKVPAKCAAGAIMLAMTIIMASELLINAETTFLIYTPHERTEYMSKQAYMDVLLDDISMRDSSLFRVGDVAQLTPNDGMLYGYPSGVHHSSTENLAVVDFLNAAGFIDRGWRYRTYFVQNIITDSIFGFKYILPLDKRNTMYTVNTTNTGQAYHQNPYALPLIFASPGSFENIETDGKSEPEIQAILADRAINAGEVYDVIEPLIQGNGIINYVCKTAGPVYLFSTKAINCIIEINGQRSELIRAPEYGRLLGFLNIGDTVSIRLSETPLPEGIKIYLSQTDISKFSLETKRIQSKTESVERVSNTVFEAVVMVEPGDKLFITMPYSSGWEMFADGERVEIKKALNEFMGAELEPGTHTLVLRYTRPGAAVGSAVSAAAFGIFIIYVGVSAYKRSRRTKWRSAEISASSGKEK